MNKIKTMLIKDVSPELNRSLDMIRADKYYGINKNDFILLALSEWIDSKKDIEEDSEKVDF